MPDTDELPADVRRLVIAARVVAFEDQGPTALKELDEASEAFADRVPWENEAAMTPIITELDALREKARAPGSAVDRVAAQMAYRTRLVEHYPALREQFVKMREALNLCLGDYKSALEQRYATPTHPLTVHRFECERIAERIKYIDAAFTSTAQAVTQEGK